LLADALGHSCAPARLATPVNSLCFPPPVCRARKRGAGHPIRVYLYMRLNGTHFPPPPRPSGHPGGSVTPTLPAETLRELGSSRQRAPLLGNSQ